MNGLYQLLPEALVLSAGGGLFVCLLLFLSRCMEPEGLWQRLVAAQQSRRPFSSRSTHFRPPPNTNGGIVGVSQHLLLPRSAEKHYPKNKRKEKKSCISLVSSIPTLPSPREWARPWTEAPTTEMSRKRVAWLQLDASDPDSNRRRLDRCPLIRLRQSQTYTTTKPSTSTFTRGLVGGLVRNNLEVG